MYAKKEADRWWLYFDNKEEAMGVYRIEEKDLWQDNYSDTGWAEGSYDFSCDITNYRRQLTAIFTVRESFEVGDKVCWCGVNGEVYKTIDDQIHVRLINNQTASFTLSGRYFAWHKVPSLFHGHNVLRHEDQKYPAAYTLYTPKKSDKPKVVDIQRNITKVIRLLNEIYYCE